MPLSQLYESTTIYLLLAIGLRGRIVISQNGLGESFITALASVELGAHSCRWCEEYIKNYQEGKGIALKQKSTELLVHFYGYDPNHLGNG